MSRLRTAVADDFPFIRKIAARPENHAYIEDEPDHALQKHLNDPDATIVIWEHEGHSAGFALFCGLSLPDSQTELRRLGLDQTDKGLGQTFLRDLIAYGFEDLDKARIWLDVVPNNPRAIRSYQNAGFTQDTAAHPVWKRPDGTSVDLLVFDKTRDTRA